MDERKSNGNVAVARFKEREEGERGVRFASTREAAMNPQLGNLE